MAPTMYSHRLKSVLQQTVRELGLTVVLDDHRSEMSLADYEAMIAETTQLLGISVDVQRAGDRTTITFYK
ncbi:hypothetical protein ACERZ8_07810 [Tateyamaria armeniaca]|uniref:Uncharacterized protein n=1 Tax=Tateyamaria armeniaca TaxID=2518930 RepID=A0ABW8USB9_9RHOB